MCRNLYLLHIHNYLYKLLSKDNKDSIFFNKYYLSCLKNIS